MANRQRLAHLQIGPDGGVGLGVTTAADAAPSGHSHPPARLQRQVQTQTSARRASSGARDAPSRVHRGIEADTFGCRPTSEQARPHHGRKNQIAPMGVVSGSARTDSHDDQPIDVQSDESSQRHHDTPRVSIDGVSGLQPSVCPSGRARSSGPSGPPYGEDPKNRPRCSRNLDSILCCIERAFANCERSFSAPEPVCRRRFGLQPTLSLDLFTAVTRVVELPLRPCRPSTGAPSLGSAFRSGHRDAWLPCLAPAGATLRCGSPRVPG